VGINARGILFKEEETRRGWDINKRRAKKHKEKSDFRWGQQESTIQGETKLTLV